MKYIIKKERLLELLAAEAELMALNQGGVDNWEWAGESCSDFLAEGGHEEFSEVAEEWLNNMVIVDEVEAVYDDD